MFALAFLIYFSLAALFASSLVPDAWSVDLYKSGGLEEQCDSAISANSDVSGIGVSLTQIVLNLDFDKFCH